MTKTTVVPMTQEMKTRAREAIDAINPGPAWLLPPSRTGFEHSNLVVDRTELVNGVGIQKETDDVDLDAIREALEPIFGRLAMITLKDALSPNVQDALDTVGQPF